MPSRHGCQGNQQSAIVNPTGLRKKCRTGSSVARASRPCVSRVSGRKQGPSLYVPLRVAGLWWKIGSVPLRPPARPGAQYRHHPTAQGAFLQSKSDNFSTVDRRRVSSWRTNTVKTPARGDSGPTCYRIRGASAMDFAFTHWSDLRLTGITRLCRRSSVMADVG